MAARTQALVLTCRWVRKRVRASWISGGVDEVTQWQVVGATAAISDTDQQ